MLPGAAGFSGAHRKGLEEPGLVEPCPAGTESLERCQEEPTAVVKKQQATGRSLL